MTHKPSALALVLTLAAATSVHSQTNLPPEATQLPTVTVIGEAPDLPQQETVTASVVAGDLFELGGYNDTRELTAIAPNTSLFDGNNNRTPRFSVRGFRENNFLIGEPTVALYVDDVPFVDVASRGIPLYDIQQAEFYRGPQGTLFGANGIGGVMNIRTEQPGNDWHGHATAGYGSYNAQDYQVGISGPVTSNQLAIGISGLFATQDGYVDNRYLGSDADNRETLSGRGVLRWTPTEQWDISLSLTAEHYRDDFIPTYYKGSDAGRYDVYRNIDGHNDTDAFGQALRVAYDAESFKVISITSHRDWKQDLLQDFDFTTNAILNGFSKPEVKTWSQEIRVQSPDNGERTQWLGGLFYADTTTDTDSGSEIIPAATTVRTTSEQTGQTYAAFGQATYSATEKLDLVGGLRLNYETRDISRNREFITPGGTFPAAAPYSTDFDDTYLLPKAGFAWHFNDDLLGYFSFSGGYQSGGYNPSNDDPTQSKFDPATSWNYEAGLKSDWADHCYSANLAFFYTDTKDYQVYRLDPDDPAQAYVENADRARMMGAELEFAARPAKGWEFSGGIGYTHAEYDDYYDAVNDENLDGNTISFVPEFTANVAGQYRFPCGFYTRVEVQALGDYYLTEDNDAQQSAFGLLNARIGYDTKHWGIYVYGRNILDKEYYANALDLRSTLTPDQLIYQPGNPAVFGVALTARF